MRIDAGCTGSSGAIHRRSGGPTLTVGKLTGDSGHMTTKRLGSAHSSTKSRQSRSPAYGRAPQATNGSFVTAEREACGPVVRQLRSASMGWYGSISYSQGGRSNDRDLSTAVLRAGSANALRGHRQCRGLAVPTNPAGRSGTFMDGSPRSAGMAAACTHGDGRQHWQADDGVPPVQSALRNAINLSSGR